MDLTKIAIQLIKSGVIKDEYIQSNGKPTSSLLFAIKESIELNENINTMNESKLQSIISKLVNESIEEFYSEIDNKSKISEEDKSKDIESIKVLVKKLKVAKSAIDKVPEDIKPKIVNKINQLQKTIKDYLEKDTKKSTEPVKENAIESESKIKEGDESTDWKRSVLEKFKSEKDAVKILKSIQLSNDDWMTINFAISAIITKSRDVSSPSSGW